MNWKYCNLQFDAMRALQIGHSDFAYLDYVYRTEQSDLADDGYCTETDTNIGRRIVLSKSAVGRMRSRMLSRGLIESRADGAVRTTAEWRDVIGKKSSKTQPRVATRSSETLQGSSETLQGSSETLQDTYIYNTTINEKKSNAVRGDAFLIDEPIELAASEAAPVKEKSCAKKESAVTQPGSPRRMVVRSFSEARAIRDNQDRAAGTPAALDDTDHNRKHYLRLHLAYLTDTIEGQRDWQDIRTEVGAKPGELERPHATAKWLAKNQNVSFRKVACRGSFVDSLGGAARTQLNIDRTAAKNHEHYATTKSNRPRPANTVLSKETIYEGAEAYLRECAEREAAGWG